MAVSGWNTGGLTRRKKFLMKAIARQIFSPILKYFESGTGEYSYRKSHRTILVAVGGLFLVLSTISGFSALGGAQTGAFIPIAVFFVMGFVCLLVGGCGTDRAVATIWGSKPGK